VIRAGILRTWCGQVKLTKSQSAGGSTSGDPRSDPSTGFVGSIHDAAWRAFAFDGTGINDMIDPAAVGLLANRLKTPLQIEQYLALAFEEAFRISERPVSNEGAGTLGVGFGRRFDRIANTNLAIGANVLS
jgi:hypothetical protein